MKKHFQENSSLSSKMALIRGSKLIYVKFIIPQFSFKVVLLRKKITRLVTVQRSGLSCWAHPSKCQMLHFNRKIYLIPNWPFHLWFGNHVVSFRLIKAKISLVMKESFKLRTLLYLFQIMSQDFFSFKYLSNSNHKIQKLLF